MVNCDHFELIARLVEEKGKRILEFKFFTDLPAGTRAIQAAHREYLDCQNQTCLWVGSNQALDVLAGKNGELNGNGGRIDIDDSDDHAHRLFKEINQGGSSGITSSVSEWIDLIVTVGARQRLKLFGKNNCNLSGAMVSDSGGINIIEVRQRINAPLLDCHQPNNQSS